jgi:hypothetical protein
MRYRKEFINHYLIKIYYTDGEFRAVEEVVVEHSSLINAITKALNNCTPHIAENFKSCEGKKVDGFIKRSD